MAAWSGMAGNVEGKARKPGYALACPEHGREKDEVRRSRAHPWEWRTLGIHLLGRASERLGRGVLLTV